MVYDKSKMQHKDNILRFKFGEYPAIGIKHFEERRDERTKPNSTDVFDETGLSDEKVLRKCFDILFIEKYKFIKETVATNNAKGLHTEWIVAFETDEIADNGKDFLFVFVVFSISIKETAMNGIAQGQEFLSCITIVKDTYKKKRKLAEKTIEATLCYYRDTDGGDYKWRTNIPR